MMDREDPVRGWYPGGMDPSEAEGWYRAAERLPAADTNKDTDTEADLPLRTGKKRRAVRIVAVVLCAALLCSAVLTALAQARRARERAQESTAAASGSAEYPILPFGGSQGGGSYDDFHEYFENYYTGSDSVDIPKAPGEAGMALQLRPQTGEPLSLQEIYERVSPAVVGIIATRQGVEYSWGTGVMFTPDGYLITNAHVISGCDGASVVFPGDEEGEKHTALLVGSDTASDIAVLKLEGEGFPYAEFGTSDGLRVGDEAVAIGNPLGEAYAGTMTNGIISAINRNVRNNGHAMTLLQTNAALNEGNSGGPLVNVYGQVIGITNMKIMSVYTSTVEGIGFAIPSSVVKQVADDLLRQGYVGGYPTIGITAGPVSAEAMAMYGLPAGVYIASVNEGSDAMKKGLVAGDIILAVNGEEVRSVAEVNAIKEEFTVGDALTLTIYREGETFDVDIELVDSGVIQ